VGAYGYRAAETPALDRLAREGIRFDHAESTVPLTLPSHAAILSGLTPPHHGLRNNGAGRFPDDRPTLATRLSAAGYSTGAFVGSFVLDHRFGLARGFDVYDDEIERDPNAAGSLEAERPASQVADRALAWLEKTAQGPGGRPFFGWVHFYDAHAPYAPPEPYASRHKEVPYDGEISFVDAQIARLLDFLDRRGLADSTVVAVTADHGEALGEHGELTHGLLLYEPTLRVPLILRGPGLPAGKTVATPVGLADLAPTLAGMLGKSLTGEAGEKAVHRLDGRDLSSAIKNGREPAETELYAETEYPRTFGWSGLSAVRLGRLKYVAAPRAELYDLSRDPGETSNLLAEGVRRADLDTRIAKLEEGAVAAAPAVGRDETAAKLASLGYISGGPAGSAPSRDDSRKDPKEMAPLFRKFEEANWSLQSGRLKEAAHQLEPLIAADPKNSVFRGLLAEVYRRQKDYPRAIALYRRAVADTPTDPDARYNLAVTMQEAGRPAEARQALEEAIRRDFSRPEAHNALGIALAAEGNLLQALEQFDQAAQLDPRDARAANNRGNVLRQLGRVEEAEKAYRRAIELAPRYAEAWNGLGTLEVARGRPAAAIPDFERALAFAPQYHEVRLNRGIALETMGENRLAVAAYEDFLRAAASDAGFAQQRAVARQLIARLSGTRTLSQPEGR
jgi:arylsulfatase A-like enzyme/Flp pilus assembly protein TadD